MMYKRRESALSIIMDDVSGCPATVHIQLHFNLNWEPYGIYQGR